MEWNQIWTSVKDFFNNNFWNIVIFLAVLIIGVIVVKLLMNIMKRILKKTRMENVTQSFLLHIIKFLLYLVLILILFSILGVSMSGILTTISAAVLAVGMALQNIITNIANGIVIVSMHMFKKGDYITVSGVEGSVDDVNFLFTTVMTPDNKKITIPNSFMLNNAVTNNGGNPIRRVDFYFDVAYESDVALVKKVILDVMKSNGKVRTDKPLFCRLKYLQSSSIQFFANCWVDSEDYWDVYYYVMEYTFNEFKRNGISIPYNQVEYRERTDKVVMPYFKNELHERVDKERKTTKKFALEDADLLAVFHRKKKDHDKKKDTKPAEKTETKVEPAKETKTATKEAPKTEEKK